MSKYEGDEMLICPLDLFDFRHTCAVIVSGDKGNPCGHALLHVGDAWYFHVAGFYKIPKYMHEDGYKRYMRENRKLEISRWPIKLPNPHGAHQKLHELLSKKWFWGIVVHNCATFVEQILEAGGSNAYQMFNCPSAEAFAP